MESHSNTSQPTQNLNIGAAINSSDSIPVSFPEPAGDNLGAEKQQSGETGGKRFGKENARHGARGKAKGTGREAEGSGGRKRRSDIGRVEWSRTPGDKRSRNSAAQEATKRRKLNNKEDHLPIYAQQFSKEEIENEEKKPKRKVAVMIGYSGSGYKGMQLNHSEKTIEGDLFKAFVEAGAISKANADDPKKSSLVRCARTDKGVHAAGNLISLKLIIEDPDIVTKINEKLCPQIRVFGIERTNGSFSAYQMCDSRVYEYLIPSYSFLPPHPECFLSRQLMELAKEVDDIEGYLERQHEVSRFWEESDEQYVKPILEQLDPSSRPVVLKILRGSETEDAHTSLPANDDGVDSVIEHQDLSIAGPRAKKVAGRVENPVPSESRNLPEREHQGPHEDNPTPLDLASKQLKAAYITARKSYRIHPNRLARVRSVLSRFIGTQNYHNYTVDKSFRDASAKRTIKSFIVHKNPITVNGTEWLSLKVHGQSFMMHQIRKMISMAALVVRCGCPEERLQDSFRQDKISIPKAPGLGLLLERPVFDTYNERLVEQFGRASLDFGRYEKEIEEFKQREIYERIFREEERDNQFHSFFASIDNLKTSQLLYLSSIGIPATKRNVTVGNAAAGDATNPGQTDAVLDGSSSEDENVDAGEG